MATAKRQFDNRSSNCLRKYKIFFVFGITILCVQVYLAYTFFAFENESRGVMKSSSNEAILSVPDKLDTNTMKGSRRNRTTRVKLDVKLLNFTPTCEISGREAVSAITRAQTQSCKQHIANVTCLSQQGTLYPKSLKSSCQHSPGFVHKPKNLGCFKDDKTLKVLTGYYAIYKSENSPEYCASMCLQSGYVYSGVEYSIECFCGMEEPPQVRRLPDSSCNMKCPGNPKSSCGGYLTINVFWNGIQKFRAQEAKNTSSKASKEKPARVAYLLTVNGRASRQVKRLISVLYHPSHFFYIHVDARQDYIFREMLEVERKCKNKNIRVARGEGLRHASIWGGASLLTTLLTSANEMLSQDHNWDFLVNLSESDFPVKSDTRLTEFLSLNKGMNFVKSHGREVQRFVTKQGLDKSFVECEARMWRIGDRKLPTGIQIDGGSDWVALSRDFVEYAADPKPDPLISGLLRVFQHTLLPAESFFHTALRNSRFCDTYIDNNLHVTNWKRKLGCKCQYRAVVDWCGCSPNDFKSEDFGRIRNTADRNLFFARKFEPTIDQRIIDRTEEWIYPSKVNASQKLKGYDTYWQSLYHYADVSPLADDTLLTISNSLARLTYKNLNIDPDIFNHIKLLETTAYFRSNSFLGILIRCNANTKDLENLESSTFQNEFPEQVESLISLKRNITITKSWQNRIRSLIVNTEYDQKEQTFRNLLGGISPISSPILAYELTVGSIIMRNLSVLWVDPHGQLADVNQLQVDEVVLFGHVKPQIVEPLVIGTWHVIIMAESDLVAKLNFLITPLAYWRNQKITSRKAREIHNGPMIPYKVTHNTNHRWTNYLSSSTATNVNSGYTEQRIGPELDRWIDALVSEYYGIKNTCWTMQMSKIRGKLEKCGETSWSSLSPDYKSDVCNLC
ncbi:xylosyltransferase oxt [Athalia rosae]|uniref:xylosyltransferase oxt n=1 Tax=Athalia rosae TaxID=37344 RepID=UPI0020348DF5|nr:xylosyltransferase oxt [Athalia rosae]XP_048509753.1 xylosyltransferase oxt [Athalia rosae]